MVVELAKLASSVQSLGSMENESREVRAKVAGIEYWNSVIKLSNMFFAGSCGDLVPGCDSEVAKHVALTGKYDSAVFARSILK